MLVGRSLSMFVLTETGVPGLYHEVVAERLARATGGCVRRETDGSFNVLLPADQPEVRAWYVTDWVQRVLENEHAAAYALLRYEEAYLERHGGWADRWQRTLYGAVDGRRIRLRQAELERWIAQRFAECAATV
jgi:hypothetical protein